MTTPYKDLKILASKRNGKQFNIANICEGIELTWEFENSAGILDTSYTYQQEVDLEEGDCISVILNGVQIFFGWVFRKTITPDYSVKLRVYDVKRYLQYTDVDVTGNETIDKLFTRICKMANIKYNVVDTSSYIIPSKIHDGVSYNDILQYGIDQTFIHDEAERFCLRAKGDVLELFNVAKHQEDILLGDNSLLTDYEFTTDIENTYTAFKIQREIASEEQKQKNINDAKAITLRKNFTLQPAENIKKWGVLQYYEKKDAKWTDSQLNDRLNYLNTRFNRQTKTLKLDCIGNIKCMIGNRVNLHISKLAKEKVAQKSTVLITSAKHKLSHNEYTMQLTVEVS